MSYQPPEESGESNGDDQQSDESKTNRQAKPPDTCGLKGFARNRYFHGKLMTARDMELEQEYNVRRLNSFARTVAGEGIVCGLTVKVKPDGESVSVSVDPGYALDCCGRAIVLASGEDTTFGPDEWKNAPPAYEDADGDELAGISLYVKYTQCWTEKVPSPGSEDACGEDCEYNRVVEDYEIVVRKGTPKHPKPVPQVEFPTSDDFDLAEPAEVPDKHHPKLQEIATSYNESVEDARERPCECDGDGLVFLGHYEQAGDAWERQEAPRTYAYDNELLYAAITRHATDYDNPHEVVGSLNGRTGHLDLYSPDETIDIDPEGEAGRINVDVAQQYRSGDVTIEDVGPDAEGNIDLTSLNETITYDTPEQNEEGNWVSIELRESLRNRINSNRARLDQHAIYVRDKTLKLAIESFYKVAVVFADSEANDLAVEAIRTARDAVREKFYESPEEYFDSVSDLTDTAADVRDAVQTLATQKTFGMYADAVHDLVTLRDGLAPDDSSDYWSATPLELIELTLALDWVCETAGWLRKEPDSMTLPGDHEISGSIAPDIIRGSGYHRQRIISPTGGGGTSSGGASSGDTGGTSSGGEVVIDDTVIRDNFITDLYTAELALTDVEGIASGRQQMLTDAGITSVKDLLETDTQEIVSNTDLTKGTVETLKKNAMSQLQQ